MQKINWITPLECSEGNKVAIEVESFIESKIRSTGLETLKSEMPQLEK